MFDWNDMRHFVALAEAGTLSGAARKLRVDHVTVARHIAALEHSLGEILVDRLGRRWQLTDAGRHVARVADGMQAQAHALERAVRSRKAGALAKVTVSAPPAFASAFLAPRVAELTLQHREIELTLLGAQPMISLSRQEADIAIRLTRPTEPSYVSRRIGSISYGLYARPGYVSRPPEEWRFIAYHSALDHVPEQLWLLDFANGRRIGFRSNDLLSQLAAVREGLGIAALPRFLAAADKGVTALPMEQAELSRDVYLVVHMDIRRHVAVRIVMEYIAKKLASDFPRVEQETAVHALGEVASK
ncbi:DNA-binding transcriptional LysR family regulator [Paraburkholderia sp. BL6669N2]|uniref:LysR family transcriptional regulator n=1 Tax=Paraburkholderia sp. BL6669N2 TaxID=1938807 RepID=UPI000E2581F2|nr:LysR family transcriptional regulator [Paraburkholderia sp. BL6669N2]REG48615.1 DNA-binding transcriptional LysR family regulator [Paraburkholderia sp. BL6669N2]